MVHGDIVYEYRIVGVGVTWRNVSYYILRKPVQIVHILNLPDVIYIIWHWCADIAVFVAVKAP